MSWEALNIQIPLMSLCVRLWLTVPGWYMHIVVESQRPILAFLLELQGCYARHDIGMSGVLLLKKQ